MCGHQLEQQTSQGIPALQQLRSWPRRRLSGAPPACRQLPLSHLPSRRPLRRMQGSLARALR